MVNLFNHPICFTHPERVGSASARQEHIPFSLFLLSLLRPSVIVDVGIEFGDFYRATCYAVKELNLTTRCYAVRDRQDSDEEDPGEFWHSHDQQYGSFSRLLDATSDTALSGFPERSIDLLNVVVRDSYEETKHLLEFWLPKVSPRGVVVLFGTNRPESRSFAGQFLNECGGRYPAFEFAHGGGLTIFAVGESLSSEVLELFTTTPADGAVVRKCFLELGRRFSLYNELREAHDKLAGESAAALAAPGGRVVRSRVASPEGAQASRDDVMSSAEDKLEAGLKKERDRLAGRPSETRTRGIDRFPRNGDGYLAAEQERLAQQLIVLESRLRDQSAELDERNRRLHRITSSLAWRLLGYFGKLKYGVMFPLLSTIRYPWESLVVREYRPALSPLNDLRLNADDQRWESTGCDPQFQVVGPWPQGWAKVSVEIESEEPDSGRARLYADRRDGFSEVDSCDLGAVDRRRETYFRLGPEVISLRFDPMEAAGEFRIKEFSLRRVRRREAQRKLAGPDPSRLKSFIEFSRQRAMSFREKNGRWPGARDLPGAVRRTMRAWHYQKAAQVSNSNAAAAIATYQISPPIDPYDAWLEVNQWSARRDDLLRAQLADLQFQPLISVVMPVYNPPLEFLEKAINSVAEQVYDHWELCIADDASTDPGVRAVLERWSASEPRIRVVFREANGHISRATNSAAELARGEYIALMDQDDVITPDALAEVALSINQNPEADILYSDDDKTNSIGYRFAPQFKPDWSPELLLSYMYFSHLFVLKTNLFREVGGMRTGFEGSQDYDLALRATEIARQVIHIPKILYHWRALPSSTASSGAAKPESLNAGMRAVQDALDRRGIQAKAFQTKWAAQAACGIFHQQFPDNGPRVAIIIPTRNNYAVLRQCLESLKTTTYQNYEIVVVDNESDDIETLAFLRDLPHKVLRIPNPDKHFSFAAINNRAVEQVEADYVLLLNDDTEVVSREWLSQMVGYMNLPDVGAVGARLIFPDGRIQHAGIVHGYYKGMAGPAFKLLPVYDHGYLSYTTVARNYSAVTAACMLTSRELYLNLGGLDEEKFSVAYNDVDYCYRLQEAGYRSVYCPGAELIHHEGYSRGFVDNPVEPATFRKKYRNKIDSYYNPNLSLQDERFAVDARAVAPARLKPIRTLLCAFNLNWEGAPYSQFELTARLKDLAVIDPIVYSPQEGPLRAAYEKRGIQVEVFEHPLKGVRDLKAYNQAIDRFATQIERWDVELVYGNTRQTFYAIDAAKRLDLPSIWNQRESEPWSTYFDYLGPGIASRALQCFVYPYKVIFVSDSTLQGCEALNAHHNFTTIHNGLDRERFDSALNRWRRNEARKRLGVGPDEVAVVLVGTVCERKGQLDLVQAIARLDEASASRLRCFIVGDRGDSYSSTIEENICGLPDSKAGTVTLVPETSETALYYSAGDIFVCTSRIESFPRVILEAMAAGLPVITTPVFGITEQVQENINALFFQPGDPARLAFHLKTLVTEPTTRKRLGQNSRAVLETLTDFDAMVSSYKDVFQGAWLSGRSR